ncbi:helix-turn-helix domain-containing protein [Ramlibacter sp. AN1133]|uniref:helix-turn-helix domain-containing protein n=1 Tax=Ramlibacter sp. AN1133 TaxID=3133429 RepID=UPI0030C2ED5B
MLYGNHTDGFFTHARKLAEIGSDGRPKWDQKCYPLEQLESVLQASRGAKDVYLSQSTFLYPSRQEKAFLRIRCVYIDLDIYNAHLQDSEGTIRDLLLVIQNAGIPLPTTVTRSGRGLYVRWFLKDAVRRWELPQWKALQARLSQLLVDFAPDGNAKDVSRVLRFPGCVHSETGALAETRQLNAEPVALSELTEAALKAVPNIRLARKTAEKGKKPRAATGAGALCEVDVHALKGFIEANKPLMPREHSTAWMNLQRAHDLVKVIDMRGGVPVGQRTEFTLWLLNLVLQASDRKKVEFDKFMGQLLLGMPLSRDFDPQEEGSMQTLERRQRQFEAGERHKFHGREYDIRYNPSNDFLIGKLGITAEEQQHLTVVIDEDEKRRRREAKHPQRVVARDGREQRRVQAVELRAQGLSIRAIATALGVSQSTIHRDLDTRQEGAEYVETRGRRAGRDREKCPHYFTPVELARRTRRHHRPHLAPLLPAKTDAARIAATMQQLNEDQARRAAGLADDALDREQRSRLEDSSISLRIAVSLTRMAQAAAKKEAQTGPRGATPSNSPGTPSASWGSAAPPIPPPSRVGAAPPPNRLPQLLHRRLPEGASP